MITSNNAVENIATIFFFSQKGGTGKSTLARAFAVEIAREGIKVLLADLDYGQQTSYKWSIRRKSFGAEPLIECQSFIDYTAAKIHALRNGYQIMVIDGPAFSSEMSKEIAHEASVIIHPVRPSLDDLEPAVVELNSLRLNGIDTRKFLIVISQVPSFNSGSEKFARNYLSSVPYSILDQVVLYKPTYAKAQAVGLTITEVTHQQLQEKATQFMKSLIEKITSI